MLNPVEADRVRAALVENVARFARSPMAREFVVPPMRRRGIEVVCATGDNLTATDGPSRIMMRQVVGAFAEYKKARLVQKLRGARDEPRYPR